MYSFTTLPCKVIKQQSHETRVPWYIVVFSFLSLIPEHELLIMAESTLNTEIELYWFDPTTVACYSDEDSGLDETETDMQEQVSFMEHLGKVDWCSCFRCIPMLCGINCQCCREMDSVHEQLMEWEEINCITSHNQFSVVFLIKTSYIQCWWWWTEKNLNPCS